MEPISVDPVSIRPFTFNRPRTNQEPYYSTDPITTIFFFLFPIFFDIFLSKFETDAFLNSSFLVQWTLLVVDVNILRIESRRLFFFFHHFVDWWPRAVRVHGPGQQVHLHDGRLRRHGAELPVALHARRDHLRRARASVPSGKSQTTTTTRPRTTFVPAPVRSRFLYI